jgi:ABC-2 type transport system ATP-binding protein
MSLDSVERVELEDGFFHLTVGKPHVVLPAIVTKLASNGVSMSSLSTRHASLEDVFVSLTGRHLIENPQ